MHFALALILLLADPPAPLELTASVRGQDGNPTAVKSGDALPPGKLLLVSCKAEGAAFIVESLQNVNGAIVLSQPEYAEGPGLVFVVVPPDGQVRVTVAASVGGKTQFATLIVSVGGTKPRPPTPVPAPKPPTPPADNPPVVTGRLHVSILYSAKSPPTLLSSKELEAYAAANGMIVRAFNVDDPAVAAYLAQRRLDQVFQAQIKTLPGLIIQADTGVVKVAQAAPATADELIVLLKRLRGA